MSFDNQSNSPEPSQENPSTSGTDQSVDEILNQHIHEHDATLQVLSESEEALLQASKVIEEARANLVSHRAKYEERMRVPRTGA